MKNKNTAFAWFDLLRAYWYFSKGHRIAFIGWFFVLFLLLLYTLVPAFIIGKIVDFFIAYHGGSLTLFYFYILLLGISYALVSIARLISKYKLSNIAIYMKYEARVKGFEKLLDFSLHWHDKQPSGNKAQRIQTGTNALAMALSIFKNDLLPVITATVGVLVVFLFLSIHFALIALAYVIIFIAIQRYFYRKIQILNNKKFESIEQASGAYYEGLSNVLTLKTLDAQGAFKKNIINKETVSKDFDTRIAFIRSLQWQVFQVFNGISLFFFLFITGQQLVAGLITIGMIAVLYNYITQLTDAANKSMQLIDDLVDTKVAIGRMMPIYWSPDTTKRGEKGFPHVWDSLAIRNGTFRYTSDAIALNTINLTITRNQKIGIVGESGSGKSTLTKILAGLYPLTAGEYTIGTTNFYDIRYNDTAQKIVLVLQDSEMFNLSLKDNLTLFRTIDADTLAQALHIACLEDLIQQLPDGLDTLLGEKGYRLSGGERQRIGLARALCRNPQILILDEATSSLDSKTEEVIQSRLEHYLQEKTVICIAHRVSTLRNVDMLYVIDKRTIVEKGTYEDLSKNPHSIFTAIYKQQRS